MEESSYYLNLKRSTQNPCIPLNFLCLSCLYYRKIGVGYCILDTPISDHICIFEPVPLNSTNDNNNS